LVDHFVVHVPAHLRVRMGQDQNGIPREPGRGSLDLEVDSTRFDGHFFFLAESILRRMRAFIFRWLLRCTAFRDLRLSFLPISPSV
jgi:hypothetical protein